jgi:alpha-tubulin suppressor-like RCC1 family protein
MFVRNRNLTLFPAALAFLLMLFNVRQSAQGPAISITPQNPTIAVGQTQQFTAVAALAPTTVSAGGEYTCISLPDGTARCAGRNQFGQLGNGTGTNSSVLVTPSGLASAAVVAGDEFTCALKTDGTAMCWGLGEKGQRGDGTYDQGALTPVPVQGLTTATALSGGYNHACALLANGTLRCWGSNEQGQLGNPSTLVGSAAPVAVPDVSGVLAMSAGAFHTCAVLLDRTVRCWGRNDSGQLGDGTYTTSFTPVTVSGLSNVDAIAGGGSHTCALLGDGSIRCWGNNYEGELGDGTATPSPTPVQVTGIANAVQVAGGWAHTCARLSTGALRCWGEGTSGELGDGAMQTSTTPVDVSGISTAVGLTAGWYHHSCALLTGASVRCWGVNEWGQFGNGTTTGSAVPVAMSGAGISGITWTSSAPAVATIDSAGRATGVGAGVTTITATDASGATASTTLIVFQPIFRLTVSTAGLGSALGDVSSSPAGITCGSDCSEDYAAGTVVTLTASPALLLTSWTGCDAVNGATCTVTMSAAKSVTANFLPVLNPQP